jgi:uncharacterized repeat protein (TIGR01451 family)
MEVFQVPGYPSALGDSIVAINALPCVGGVGYFTDWVGQFPYFDGSASFDEDCQPNRSSFDPNEKTAMPEGIGAMHNVLPNTTIEYMVRFQNTGSDTALNVSVADTVDANFDLSTFKMLNASHPYSVSFGQNGAVLFTFNGINLPDSTHNELASHGFVKYSVRQKHNLPEGIALRNRASIYFDFNAPVVTNETVHHVGTPWANVLSVEYPEHHSGTDVRIFPNPMGEYLQVEVRNPPSVRMHYRLYSSMGVLVRDMEGGSVFSMPRGDLAKGLYVLDVVDGDGVMVARGKVVVE